MIKITEQDLDNLQFDGIIVSVPKVYEPGRHNDITFITECNYYTNGKHGYKEPGHGADDSSFYHIAYNMDNLPKGLWMNATSRFTLDHIFRFDINDYYKFQDMEEFCTWYLQNRNYDVWLNSNDLKGKIHEVQPTKRITNREKYKDIIDYIERYVKWALCSKEPNLKVSQIKPIYDSVNEWLDREAKD